MWRVDKGKWPFPVAIVLNGSVVQRIVWGFTRGHAVRRAQKLVRNRMFIGQLSREE